MRKDALEEFIGQNRDTFDQEIPSGLVWERIAGSKPKKKTKIHILKWTSKIAATFAVLLACTFAFGNDYFASQVQQIRINDRLPDEFKEIEQYYQEKCLTIFKHLVDLRVADVVEDDLFEIDQTINQLKLDLVSTLPGTENEIIDNILKSYRIKLKILTRVLERVETHEPESINIDDNESTL